MSRIVLGAVAVVMSAVGAVGAMLSLSVGAVNDTATQVTSTVGGATQGDDFVFSYAPYVKGQPPGSWTTAGKATANAKGEAVLTFSLTGTSGAVWVRAMDAFGNIAGTVIS